MPSSRSCRSCCHVSAGLSPAALATSTLAPLALDAYPEAYSEFKRSMLYLLSQPGAGQQHGLLGKLSAGEAVVDARRQLAGMVYRTIREALGECG